MFSKLSKLLVILLFVLSLTACSKSPVGVWVFTQEVDSDGKVYSSDESIGAKEKWYLVFEKNNVVYDVTTYENEYDYVYKTNWTLSKKGDYIYLNNGETKLAYDGKKITMKSDFSGSKDIYEKSKRKFNSNELAELAYEW